MIRLIDFFQAVPLRSLCSMPLAGHSPTIPLVFPCNLFFSAVCGLSSAGTPLFPAHTEPATLAACMLSECYVLAGQMLKHCSSRQLLAGVSAGSLPPPWPWDWDRAQTGFPAEPTCKALPALSLRRKAHWSTYLWQTPNRKAFWSSLLHALACYGTCSHFLS